MYRQTITFEEVSALAIRKGVCGVCGKRGRRQRTFTMTVNPWNKNPDGSVRSRSEVVEANREKAREWQREAFVHPGCES
jgi:hypothetical protein